MTGPSIRTQGTRAACRGGALPLRLCLAGLVLLAAVPVLAQSGGGYELAWSTIDGGGTTQSSGGGYTLGGTAGQADAGRLAGGSYTLAGGFWPGARAEPPHLIYLPMALRDW